MTLLRMYDPEVDRPMLEAWWAAHKWPLIDPDALSSFGMICCVGPHAVAAGWLYPMVAKWAMIEWVVTNPDAPLKSRPVAVKCLIERLKSEGQGFGAKRFFTSLRSKGLIKIYQKCGFEITDQQMTNMVCKCP